ncbi:UDP-N-acetylmuramoyl-L-alanyl-D-glutamate--2,6-diaminopimelate ligase MurE [Maioricimonas rarisocia]|uniref:UDP-N-acetylmuramoyl-L-alanyl-D-glutamate--2,6-diaminopimelate ligase n=1 Tax=Maioricimonas rarisocia TaxID=2528026 RepID=A0A517Z1W7_9PLAN|nr:UDP-N-acetylmuramoyl-L-alanyl-D-glutamate--2,6-diaminopimelate ligase [Maioricimonas rarisocia]QDU36467.1 UDP-N-acetylmuramoyl-L-alanyl-D-glutamate--2,6-diaminopimelate ligase MurE [Maioricimonas rarisocia]
MTRTPNSVSLKRLLPTASFVGCADIAVTDAVEHHEACTPGCLFAAISGGRTDGSTLAPQAVQRGAAAVLTHRPLASIDVPQCIVPDVRTAFSQISHALQSYPTRRLGVVGITGTNGKSTVAWLVRGILEANGRPGGLLGTIEYSDGRNVTASQLTTPDSRTFAHWLGTMVRNRTRFAAVELSSHALDQGRVAGTLVDCAIVTNITRDHFDYHGDFAGYRTAKARILPLLKRSGSLILNADDPGSASLAELADSHIQIRTFSIDGGADVTGTIVEESPSGTHFRITAGTDSVEVFSPLVGRHNVSNSLAATVAALHFGLSLKDIAAGLEAVDVVPGRLERIECGQPFPVFVDYAHTDDALRHALASLRPITKGRLICVFGAGGDRDRSKRPLMGQAAAAADAIVVTSDNPRSENPTDIINDIVAGIGDDHPCTIIESDRERAIGRALDLATAGDTVLIAGKGHETSQTIGNQQIPFDDRVVSRRQLTRSRIEQREQEARVRA